MPLNPISITRSDPNSPDKLEPGRVVEYEQHSKPILAIVLREKKGKWVLLNQCGAELELPAARLYLLPGKVPESVNNVESRTDFLSSLAEEVSRIASEIELEEVWQVLLGEVKETSVEEVADILFTEKSMRNHLTVRRTLLADQVYFKRKKFGFEPRPEAVVGELKVKLQIEAEKKKQRERFVNAVLTRLKDHSAPLPEGIEALEQLAALGRNAENAKETKGLLEEILECGNLSLQGRLDDKAFELLVAIGHFSPDENIIPIRLGRPVNFDKEILELAGRMALDPDVYKTASRCDLRSLNTITVDGEETRDFDDALSVEETDDGYRIGIHISDVVAVIPENSPVEDAALRRATSIYCPDSQIPMLPRDISEGVLSLIEESERGVITFFIEVNREFNIINREICRSNITISKRLTYEEADRILCDEVTGDDTVSRMLTCLWNASAASEARRLDAGAVQFGRREMTAKVLPERKIVLEESNEDTPARKLVSEMMILANETAALFAKKNSLPLAFRSQEPPDTEISDEELRIPEGPAREYYQRGLLKRSTISSEPASHFGLGVEAYTQVTSPIRRAIDLINQRQLAEFLSRGEIHYPPMRIMELLTLIEPGLDEATQIQRERNRYWLLKYLIQEKIKEIEAVIVRTDGPRPLAELDILHSLYPFHPLARKNDVGAVSEKDLGRRVTLRVDSIYPRNQTLVLTEVQ